MAEEKFSYFVSYLKDSFDQAVVWHHQTESYAVHKALGKFYDGILGLTDGLVEFRRKKENRSFVSVIPFETAEA